MANFINKAVKALGKGAGEIVGGVAGLGSRGAKGGKGILKEAVSGVKEGAKKAYGITSGSTKASKEASEQMHKKAIQKATDSAFEFKTDMNRVANVRNADFVGPHPKDAIDNAKIVQTLDNAKNPNFVGPQVSDDKLRSMKRAVDSANPDFVGPMPVAQEMAESGPGFWDGLPNWAKYTGIATAGGIAGAVLFGDDDDNDN